MTSKFDKFSQEEAQFVRLFGLTLKQNFDEVFNTLQLMRSEIGVKCPVHAAALGRQLHEMSADFEHELALVATRRGARPRRGPAYPTVAELAALVHVSFFKLVKPADDKNAQKDLGWFSGHPQQWQTAWTHLQLDQLPKTTESHAYSSNAWLTSFLQLFHSQLFGGAYPTNKELWSNSQNDYDDVDDDEEDENDYYDDAEY